MITFMHYYLYNTNNNKPQKHDHGTSCKFSLRHSGLINDKNEGTN